MYVWILTSTRAFRRCGNHLMTLILQVSRQISSMLKVKNSHLRAIACWMTGECVVLRTCSFAGATDWYTRWHHGQTLATATRETAESVPCVPCLERALCNANVLLSTCSFRILKGVSSDRAFKWRVFMSLASWSLTNNGLGPGPKSFS